MKRKFWNVHCLVICILIMLPARAQDIETLLTGVVKVRAQTEGEARRTGTGIVVASNAESITVLTASHVVEGDRAPELDFYAARGDLVKAQVVQMEGGDPRGLAILRIARSKAPHKVAVLSFAKARPAIASEVMVIGFPTGGAPWNVVKATLTGWVGRDMSLDGNINEGNSGGPALLRGEIVGVITGTTGFARATPSNAVVDLLANWGVVLGEKVASSNLRVAGTCVQGYVWRDAFPGDKVCVLPNIRSQAAYDNSQAAARRMPNGGASGPDTCRTGFVWREAGPEDRVCVKPETRDQVQRDNQAAASRVAN